MKLDTLTHILGIINEANLRRLDLILSGNSVYPMHHGKTNLEHFDEIEFLRRNKIEQKISENPTL